MRKVTIYIDHVIFCDGIFTWMCNFYKLLHKRFDIEIMTKVIRNEVNTILENEGIRVVQWNKDIVYETDVLLYMLDFVVLPTNFKCDKKYKVVHCNYEIIKANFENLNDGSEFIAVSKQAADGFTKRFGLPCKDISSFVVPYDARPLMRITSCSRVYNNKGFERMFHLADDLDEMGVRFQWINYSEIDANGIKYLRQKKHNLITFLPALSHNELMDMVAASDYLVQLSEREGYCYAVHEALMMGTAVIVTDIDAFKDVVQDGVNGYKIPIEMNYDENTIRNICYAVPRGFEYKEDLSGIYDKWKEALS